MNREFILLVVGLSTRMMDMITPRTSNYIGFCYGTP